MIEKPLRVLLVDDAPSNIQIIVFALKQHYTITVANNGTQALAMATIDPQPDLILLDIMLPDVDGYQVLSRLQDNPLTKNIPVIFVTGLGDIENEMRGLKMGAADFIAKPINAELLKVRVAHCLEHKQYCEDLEAVAQEQTQIYHRSQYMALSSMASIAEYRDFETGAHIRRTQRNVRALAKQARKYKKYRYLLNDDFIEALSICAPLHDIGKVAITDAILLKPWTLSIDEFEIMKQHTTLGAEAIKKAEDVLGKNTFLTLAQEMALSHHEKWDGSGYPNGLAGDAIPLSARVMAVADVYDALITKRTYKPAFSHDKALSIMIEGRGSHFDPDLLDCLLDNDSIFSKSTLEDSDDE